MLILIAAELQIQQDENSAGRRIANSAGRWTVDCKSKWTVQMDNG